MSVEEEVIQHILIAGSATLLQVPPAGGGQPTKKNSMLLMHLAIQTAQHWYLLIQWLFLGGVINKEILREWMQLRNMKDYMGAAWSMRRPSQLFSSTTKTQRDTMVQRREWLEHQDSKEDSWSTLALSSKTAYIIKYVFHCIFFC
jgi:hypothetical protein